MRECDGARGTVARLSRLQPLRRTRHIHAQSRNSYFWFGLRPRGSRVCTVQVAVKPYADARERRAAAEPAQARVCAQHAAATMPRATSQPTHSHMWWRFFIPHSISDVHLVRAVTVARLVLYTRSRIEHGQPALAPTQHAHTHSPLLRLARLSVLRLARGHTRSNKYFTLHAAVTASSAVGARRRIPRPRG